MSLQQATASAKSSVIEYRMAIFWFMLFSVNSLCTSLLASLVNANWGDMDKQGKLLLIIAVVGNWTGTIMAFVSKQANRIKQTGEIFPTDTSFLTRTHTETDSVKQSPISAVIPAADQTKQNT